MARSAMMFVGVSTGTSYVQTLFPRWMSVLGLQAELRGVDVPLGAPPARYRSVIESVRAERQILGALITSHKLAVYQNCLDMFGEITEPARILNEAGVVFKRDRGDLGADANDFFSTEYVIEKLLATDQWGSGCRKALILGAGGAGTALTHVLCQRHDLGCELVVVVDVDAGRLGRLHEKAMRWPGGEKVVVHQSSGQLKQLPTSITTGALLVNASGLGKDQPGTPIAPQLTLPRNSTVWEFNYRFRNQPVVNFLTHARSQQASGGLVIEDGWNYFLWGWCLAIARVFRIDNVRRAHEKICSVSPSKAAR